ncbi:MAG: hypothetical protein LC792_09965 [Actinobacteria bacterium]|nr:hypothetical protein [Actinomycetota bacterium]
MSGLLVLVLVVITLSVAFFVSAMWLATGAVRRVHRLTRPVVDRATLSVKAHALPHRPAREVARLRLELRTGMEQTRRILDDARRRDCPLGELPGLFRRVEQLAESVDGELRVLEGERDRLQQGRIGAARQRSEDLMAMAATIRRDVGAVYAVLNSELFHSLRGDVDLELRALRAGVAAARGRATGPSPPR